MLTKGLTALWAFVLVWPCCVADTLREVRIQGNFRTPDDQIILIVGVQPGAEISTVSERDLEERLMKSGKFDSARVVKRQRSMTAGADVVLVITVKEKTPIKSKFMFMPILSGSDEYGLTYGVRISGINLLGERTRVGFPLTLGGTRRAAAEVEWKRGLPDNTSLLLDGSVSRKENPHFEIGDFRKEAWGGVRHRWNRFQASAGVGFTDVDFGTLRDQFVSYGADVALDTRQDVNLPRDAVYAGIGWKKYSLNQDKPSFNIYTTDLRGYKGLWGQAILAGQFLFQKADGPLPNYQRPFLGGATTLRGHEPGEYIGDNLATTSLELRLPLTSPLKIYHAGVDVFLDSGKVYDDGQTFGSADWKHGAGVGVFFLIAGFGLKVDLAHDLNDSVRVHFSIGFRF